MSADNSRVSDDLFARGLAHWAAAVRRGDLQFATTVEQCLERAADAASLDAFEYIDTAGARDAARLLDHRLQTGDDLGPLMGLPIGVKDIISVTGMPLTNGSNADTAHLSGPEGALIGRLRAAGAIVLGKTRTVEFALGSTGVNEARGTPWNPADRQIKRIPGGSSSGSAVATAAGITGFSLGTDTGGSIRIPACYTGIVGHKTSTGRWPTDGIFSLSTTFDSVGPLCRQVADAALVHTVITGESVPAPPTLEGLHFGVPTSLFLDDLDAQVAADFEQALDALQRAGARRVDIDVPGLDERTTLFTSIVPPELITSLSPERFHRIRPGMDTVTAQRAAHGLGVDAVSYLQAQRRCRELAALARATFDTVDCWLTPTCSMLAPPVADLSDPEINRRALLSSRNTQPGNLFSLCGLSLPMHRHGLPTGLQILKPWNEDASLLALGLAVEQALQTDRGCN